MVVIGLVGLVAAVLCTWGFIAATERADARVRAVDPTATSTFRGAPRMWAGAALGLSAASMLCLLGAVAGWLA